jgi:hypothetical protein
MSQDIGMTPSRVRARGLPLGAVGAVGAGTLHAENKGAVSGVTAVRLDGLNDCRHAGARDHGRSRAA